MILGHIVGKLTTREFSFKISGDAKKFEYVQVYHPEHTWVLAQIIEIEKTRDESIAKCIVIGYKDQGKITPLRNPFEHGSEVLQAQDDFIADIITGQGNAYIGKLQGKDIKVSIDLNKILTKHLCVLAKSGSGKSYTVGVLIEEIVEHNIPVLVIDPHGEYSAMRKKNDHDKKLLPLFGISPEAYKVREYGDPQISPEARQLRLSQELSSEEITQLFPGKLNATQLGILYNAIGHAKKTTLPALLISLEREENSAKWTLINAISFLQRSNIFTEIDLPYHEMIKAGGVTTINLKGYTPDIQEVIVYKLCSDLFELRKKNQISPFFLVIEEAQNFCPERSFGEATSSKILRTIASEGRKFGLGLCVISQRPARIDKSVLSQCSTQIIQKVTNPHDLKAVAMSVEGLTSEVEKEIQNLPIGTALLTGVADIPLFVTIRPRKSHHGGREVSPVEKKEDFTKKVEAFKQEEVLPVIKPLITASDISLMHEEKGTVKSILIPCVRLTCEEKGQRFDVIVDRTSGRLVTNVDDFSTKEIPDLSDLTKEDLLCLSQAHKKETIDVDNPSREKLLSKKMLVETEGSIILSDDFIFSKLINHQSFTPLQYETVSYDEKKNAEYGIMDARKKLSAFTTIIDDADCFVVRYEFEKS
jgi:DNA helicase HerA-like ATPase